MSRSDTDILLFGEDPTPGVVAVEVADREAVLYRRAGLFLEEERRPLRLWILTTDLADLPGAHWSELDGEGLRWLAQFDSLQHWQAARRAVRDAHAEHLAYPSAAKAYLSISGVTMFKSMVFDQVHRMAVDLETQGLSPTEPSARILLIAVSSNRGVEEVLSGTEEEILTRFAQLVRDCDPDVIEGHNLYGFDLPFLFERANRCGIPLNLGRDGSPLRSGPQRNCAVGGTTRPYTQFHVYGRHLIDTLFATQRFDWARGELHSYGLKEVAQALGVTEEGRVILDRRDVQAQMADDEARVRLYALQDVRETRKLSQVVGATDFYLTQMVPDTYESVAVTGTGEKIDSLLVREYIRRGHSVPLSRPARAYPGGLTECRITGVIQTVVKADVESLYPSLMLTRRIKPASDTLDG
ncbi:MAG: 3'-5' exonuclease, partial [Armatimonadota bacterium]